MHENIIKRNFVAINEALKEDRKKDAARDKRIMELEKQVAMLLEEVAFLKQKVMPMWAEWVNKR